MKKNNTDGNRSYAFIAAPLAVAVQKTPGFGGVAILLSVPWVSTLGDCISPDSHLLARCLDEVGQGKPRTRQIEKDTCQVGRSRLVLVTTIPRVP